MAKETNKRIKMSKAQQNMLMAVGGAAVMLGICLVAGVYFLKYIRFNAAVIGAKDDAIQGYSDAIKTIGVCKAPRGKVYKDSELASCTPDELTVSDVPNTLRYSVTVDMASNEDLESVARNGMSVCTNSATGEKWTYDELLEKYEMATTDKAKEENFEIFVSCSALRAIPDALPSAKNELALLASLDKIFKVSGFSPESLAPGGEIESNIEGLGAIGVNITLESDSVTGMRVLRNIEKSIREIGVNTANVEWSNGGLDIEAQATAYYTEPQEIEEGMITVTGEGKVTKKQGGEDENI